MINQNPKYNGFLNECDWDGDASSNGSSSRIHVFSSSEDRLYYLYGEINARNCADIAYDISLINAEDEEKDKKEKDYKRKPIKVY